MSWRLPVSSALTFCGLVSSRPAPYALQHFRYHTLCRQSCSRRICKPYSCSSSTRCQVQAACSQRRAYRHYDKTTAHFRQFKSGLQTYNAVANIATPAAQHTTSQEKQLTMDYTALMASVHELKSKWIPAKIEQVSFVSFFSNYSVVVSHMTLIKAEIQSFMALADRAKRQAIIVP